MRLFLLYLGMVADSFQRRRLRARRRRRERAIRRHGLHLVVDLERGIVVPGSSDTFSSPLVAAQVASRLNAITGRVHVVAHIVNGIPLEPFEQLVFGPPEASP